MSEGPPPGFVARIKTRPLRWNRGQQELWVNADTTYGGESAFEGAIAVKIFQGEKEVASSEAISANGTATKLPVPAPLLRSLNGTAVRLLFYLHGEGTRLFAFWLEGSASPRPGSKSDDQAQAAQQCPFCPHAKTAKLFGAAASGATIAAMGQLTANQTYDAVVAEGIQLLDSSVYKCSKWKALPAQLTAGAARGGAAWGL